MPNAKSTKLSIREDRPTAIASSAYGSNVNAIGFNLLFLAARNPKLAIEIMKLYAQARQVQESDPPAPDEDYSLLADELRKMGTDKSND